MIETAEKTFSFAEFELDTVKRRLLKAGQAVALNPKAFDLLTVLVKNHEQILGKEELLETVWEGSFVEENNLSVQISALRKIFGEKKGVHQFIVTVPGKGYCFVAKVRTADLAEAEAVEKKSAARQDGFQIVAPEVSGEGESIIGREREIAEIKDLLRRGVAAIITLTGAGGSGKTSLARAIAGELSTDFSDGIFFIELAALTNPELVAPTIANALGLQGSGGKTPVEILLDSLRERSVLLVLDNFEQLISTAPLLKKLANSSAHLKILVTSRAALKLPNERESIVAPLAVPPRDGTFSLEKLAEFSAVRLFAERARAAKPSFILIEENAPVIAEICQRLDGLPLAIELAAARVKLLSLPAILARLENSLNLLTGGAKDLAPRQRTMRAAIEWSYNLLGEKEKHLFGHLAVFAGGFTIEAAEAITEAEIQANAQTGSLSVLDLITSLIDNNLLVAKELPDGNVRLRMLEVVREFALECLRAGGEREILQQKHAEFFLALAEEAAPHLPLAESIAWCNRLEEEHDNLRAALGWLLAANADKAAQLAGALWLFWNYHSHFTEGRGWLKAVLERVGMEIPALVRFRLLRASAGFAQVQGDYPIARRMYEECILAAKADNNLFNLSVANRGLGMIFYLQGDYENAQRLFEEGLAISRELNSKGGIAASLNFLGNLFLAKGDRAAARPLFEEALPISREDGNREAIGSNLNNLGKIAITDENFELAQEYLAEALLIGQELGSKTVVAHSLDGFAALAEKCGAAERAAQIAGAAEKLRQAIGYEMEFAEQQFCDRYRAKIRAALDDKTFAAAFEQGGKLQLSEAVAFVEETALTINRQITEIIVETHKFERIVIDEEI